jgi:hypothetical protein
MPQPAGDRMVRRGRGEDLQVGVGADRSGEVGQVQRRQQRVAETGPEREQVGSGPYGRRVVQRREADLAQLGPPVRGHGYRPVSMTVALSSLVMPRS